MQVIKPWILPLSFLFVFPTFACTHFKLASADKTVVVGRSLEFGPDLQSTVYMVKPGDGFTSKGPDGKKGKTWQAKYGYLAVDGFHLFPVSGLNDQGLSFDLLYFPGEAAYSAYDADHADRAMPYYLMGDFLLGQFSDVEQIKAALPQVNCYNKPVKYEGQQVVFPVHFIVTDKAGQSLVIEYVDGALKLYDNASGVFTNSPGFPWQQTNIRNYVNLSAYAPSPLVQDGITYTATGQGSGALGLPGDYTPPSRFVKTSFMVSNALEPKDAKAAVNLAAHILNTVDIPKGISRGERKDKSADSIDYTQWVVIKDLAHQRLYFRSYDDLTLHWIDMQQLPWKGESANPKPMAIMDATEHWVDATSHFLRRGK